MIIFRISKSKNVSTLKFNAPYKYNYIILVTFTTQILVLK